MKPETAVACLDNLDTASHWRPSQNFSLTLEALLLIIKESLHWYRKNITFDSHPTGQI